MNSSRMTPECGAIGSCFSREAAAAATGNRPHQRAVRPPHRNPKRQREAKEANKQAMNKKNIARLFIIIGFYDFLFMEPKLTSSKERRYRKRRHSWCCSR